MEKGTWPIIKELRRMDDSLRGECKNAALVCRVAATSLERFEAMKEAAADAHDRAVEMKADPVLVKILEGLLNK